MEVPTTTKRSDRPLWIFLILACLWSWTVWVLSGVLPRGGAGAYDFRWLLAQVGVFGPSLCAWVVSGTFRRELRENSLRAIPVTLAPLVIPGILIAQAAPSGPASMSPLPSVATVIVAALILIFFSPMNSRLRGPSTGMPPSRHQAGWILLSAVFLPGLFLIAWVAAAGSTGAMEISALKGGALASVWVVLVCFAHNFLLGGPLGEEIGWRGFLLPELLKKMNPMAASLVLGIVWGVWHLPIDLYAGFGVKGPGAVLARVVYVLPLSILFTWFYLRSRGSLLVAFLLHATLNVMGDLGFSGFQSALMVLFVILAVVASIVSLSSPTMRDRTDFSRASGARHSAGS